MGARSDDAADTFEGLIQRSAVVELSNQLKVLGPRQRTDGKETFRFAARREYVPGVAIERRDAPMTWSSMFISQTRRGLVTVS